MSTPTRNPDPDLRWLEDHLFNLHAPFLPASADPEELRVAIRRGLAEETQGLEEASNV